MATEQLISDYLDEAQALSINETKSSKTRHNLLSLIERHQKAHQSNAVFNEFFKGEHAFHRGQYKIALKHYLAAKDVPFCKFFCLRASAFVLEQQGDINKAIKYAKRALNERPDDVVTLRMLDKLLPKTEATTDPVIQKTVETLANKVTAPDKIDGPVALASEEIDDLSNIFTDNETPPSPDEEKPNKHHLSSTSLQQIVSRSMEPAMDRQSNVTSNENTNTAVMERPTEDATRASAIDELSKLAESRAYEIKSTDQYMNTIGIAVDSEDGLQEVIETYQEERRDLVAEYMKTATSKQENLEDTLHILSGWSTNNTNDKTIGQELLSASCRKACGGFFVRWNGTGVAVNPGPNFLKHFHASGLHIKEIDYVIVTQNTNDAHADIESIYKLNYQLNLTAPADDLHIIHYYLNQQAHRDLAARLKPNFKQERHTVHCLELYVDSPDVEKMDLCDSVCLHYFPTTTENTSNRKGEEAENAACLGIDLLKRS